MMSNSKSTKKELISSVLAVFICVIMLIGTTFAWFTDSASTAVNKIQSGKLDVALEMKKDDGTWESAEGQTLSFKKASSAPADEEILWEPGCTYELPALRVVNKGNLALKYKIKITGIKGDAKLNEVIDWTISDAAIDDEHSLAVGATSEELIIKGHMQETAGNDYEGLAIDGIGITVLATQDTVEYDSNDNQYDKNATYPDVAFVTPDNQDDLNNAIADPVNAEGETVKEVTINLPADTSVTLDSGIADASNNDGEERDVTFIGDGTQTVDVVEKAVSAEGGNLNYQRGSSFTFENLIIQAGEGTYDGIVCDNLTYKNCTIKGKLTLYGKATFIDCTFENDMDNQYSIWTWGGTDVKFENCIFNTNGKAILLYGQANTNLTVNDCTFNDRKNGAAGKAAIEIGNDYNATYSLTVNNVTVNGFAINTAGENTNSKIWANKNSMDADHLTVTIDGEKVH